MLALSLALSPVSAFADELDTPVHEDPIDEIQEDSGWISRHFSYTYNQATVAFDVNAYCNYLWTEGISAQFKSVTIIVSSITFNGGSVTHTGTGTLTIDTYNIWARARQTFNYSAGPYSFSVNVTVFCDEYGELSLNATL